jgi:hypothetical protein
MHNPVAIRANRSLPEQPTPLAESAAVEAAARVLAEHDERHVERARAMSRR